MAGVIFGAPCPALRGVARDRRKRRHGDLPSAAETERTLGQLSELGWREPERCWRTPMRGLQRHGALPDGGALPTCCCNAKAAHHARGLHPPLEGRQPGRRTAATAGARPSVARRQRLRRRVAGFAGRACRPARPAGSRSSFVHGPGLVALPCVDRCPPASGPMAKHLTHRQDCGIAPTHGRPQ